MNDDHLNAFVSECRESITALNNALLALEADPDDEEAIESVFRTAHTLKGNFAAMGFDDASDLAHVLEDLLDAIRDGDVAVTPAVMDATFEGVDRIETIVDEIDAEGDAETDPSATVERLEAVLEAETGRDAADGEPATDRGDAGAGDDSGGATATFAVASAAPAFETVDDVETVAHAAVGVDTDGMVGVDGLLVLDSVSDAFDRVETAPPKAAVEDGDHDGRFDLFVPGADPDALGDVLAGVGAVERYETAAVPPGAEPDVDADVGSDDDTDAAGDDEADASRDDEADASRDDDTDAAPDTPAAGDSDISSVRVDVDRLDELHGLVEQLVTNRITIRRALENDDIEGAETNMNDLDKVTSRLQNTVMDMRLIPLRRVVSNLPRVVRDVARDQGKQVDFEMHGEDIELDRSILTEIEDPLIHILRNAVDHGIEPPAERAAAGKPEAGRVELRAARQRDHVTIEIEDDGGGIDPDAVRERAVEEGILTEDEAEALSDDEAYDLVFHSGFSTVSEVTDVSGRGVGMDIVSSTVEQLDGSVDVDSELGEGTTVTLRLPVSVAIVNVLFVRVGEQEYGIPIKNIDELTGADEVEMVTGDEVVRHDGEVYPVVRLDEALDIDDETLAAEAATDGGTAAESAAAGPQPGDDAGMLVRIREEVRPVALRCDEFTDQEEVVVKPLEGPLSGLPGLSGTAILGDGNIVPILDVVSLDA